MIAIIMTKNSPQHAFFLSHSTPKTPPKPALGHNGIP